MQEIVTDIFTWSWFSEPHQYDFNGYLVRHEAGNLCIDPVSPSDADLAEIARIGTAKILLTNQHCKGGGGQRLSPCEALHGSYPT